MAAYIYNCKRCKTGRRVEYPIGDARRGYMRRDESGRTVAAGIYMTSWGGGKPPTYAGDVENGICAGCNRMMTYEPLVGRVSDVHKCDARCLNARRGSCECSCGGANHGKGWAS
jgi:hypothetical protein